MKKFNVSLLCHKRQDGFGFLANSNGLFWNKVLMKKLSFKQLDLQGKKVLIRVDFNVPLKNGVVTDDSRIRAALPTIQAVLDQGAAIILMSHLGRPDGEKKMELSLAPCAKRLSELLHRPVLMAPDVIGSHVQDMAAKLMPGQILMLENLRFYADEEKPSPQANFASALASLADIYINDAFGCAHRAHASTAQITQFFPGNAAMGFLMEKEVDYLSKTLNAPNRPFYAILGGAKISSKFKVIEALMKQADKLFIGGAMAYTFLKAQGFQIGNSLVEDHYLDQALELINHAKQNNCQLFLPLDLVVTRSIKTQADKQVVSIKNGVPQGFEGVDIGPHTIENYQSELQDAQTVFWNGPLGVFEVSPFDLGTMAIANTLAKLQAVTIVGGGDSVAAIEQSGKGNCISHLSTGGGATLEFIELGQLPGIEALTNVKH